MSGRCGTAACVSVSTAVTQVKRRHLDRRHHLISMGIKITSTKRVEVAPESLDVCELAGTRHLLDSTMKLGIDEVGIDHDGTSPRAAISIGRAATLIKRWSITFNIPHVRRSATAPSALLCFRSTGRASRCRLRHVSIRLVMPFFRQNTSGCLQKRING